MEVSTHALVADATACQARGSDQLTMHNEQNGGRQYHQCARVPDFDQPLMRLSRRRKLVSCFHVKLKTATGTLRDLMMWIIEVNSINNHQKN